MEKDLIRERLREVLKVKNDTVNSFAKKSGISQRTANRQISEDTSINYALIDAFAKTYTDVDLNWLLTGSGQMIKCEDNSMAMAKDGPPKMSNDIHQADENQPERSQSSLNNEYIFKRFEELIRENESLKKEIQDLKNEQSSNVASRSYTIDHTIGMVAESGEEK